MGFGAWVTFAETMRLHDLAEKIVTGASADNLRSFALADDYLAALPAGAEVLDFGCGFGRNAIDIAKRFPHLRVHGFDSHAMVQRAAEYCRHRHGCEIADIKNLSLHWEWPKVSQMRFAMVLAIIVLQHIAPAEIADYLTAIKEMAPLLLVFGRRYNDHGDGSTWAVLESCGLYPENAAGYSAEGDKHEHTLCVYRLS